MCNFGVLIRFDMSDFNVNPCKDSLKDLVEKQRSFFRSGRTLDPKWRIARLKKLKEALISNEAMLEDALQQDLGKSRTESFLTEIGPVIIELNEAIRNLKRWARPQTHFSGLMCFPSIFTKVYKMPYGVVLICSPYNFPVYLTLGVLVAAIASGNTAVLKCSSRSSHSTAALQRLISQTFDEEYITLLGGGHDVSDMLLEQRFDKIFFTGSPKVASHIMHAAAENLTPVALELGGETGNWCVIRKDADLRDAARKIAFLKILNSGQICININQIAVASEVAGPFVEALKEEFSKQIGSGPALNPDYPKLINGSAFEKCSALAEKYRGRIVYGGGSDRSKQKFAPTVIYPVGIDEDIVMREHFSPLLPIVCYEDAQIQTLLDTIESREHPLAMYIFTRDVKWAERVMSSMQFGGGCINEVCVHMMASGAPFGGTGHSGMGAYHGKWGFREFTHPQTVLLGSSRFNLALRLHPYGGKGGARKLKLLRLLEK